MGALSSSHLGERQCQYLRGRAAVFLNHFMPYYQRQLAMAFLKQISSELMPQGQTGFQLLKSERPPPAVIHEGILTRLQGSSPKWRESYCVLSGNYSLEWFGSKEEQRRGEEPQESIALTGYTLVVSWRECLYQRSSGNHFIQDPDPIMEPPLEFPIYLCHPFRQPLCLCTDTLESQDSWKSVLRDGIRHRGTECKLLKGRDYLCVLSPSSQRNIVCSLGDMPWDLGLMQPCYQKAELYWNSLQGLKERFGFHGTRNLVFSAQDLMQQLMENAVYTFQQLSEKHTSSATRRRQVVCLLEKVKGRVLKKFESDSRFAQKHFVQEWLVQIFLPYLLRRLEVGCKLEMEESSEAGMDSVAELRGFQLDEKKDGMAETCTHATLSTWNLESIPSSLHWDSDPCQDLLQDSHCEGGQEETERRNSDTYSTQWPLEMLDKDPEENKKNILLKGLTLAMDTEAFQTDLLEMDLRENGSFNEWGQPEESLKARCPQQEPIGSSNQAGDIQAQLMADGIYSNVAVQTLHGRLGKGMETLEGEVL
ncbi:protein Niban 3 [Gracilinanus agilis]|uniref:protein Niban 3 n=1 Tax=Gracilinanus agilis TaxID=191870 RepID=UPI001CFD8972|nr:protein Niban 3 [Gracilinanus agilis]